MKRKLINAIYAAPPDWTMYDPTTGKRTDLLSREHVIKVINAVLVDDEEFVAVLCERLRRNGTAI